MVETDWLFKQYCQIGPKGVSLGLDQVGLGLFWPIVKLDQGVNMGSAEQIHDIFSAVINIIKTKSKCFKALGTNSAVRRS